MQSIRTKDTFSIIALSVGLALSVLVLMPRITLADTAACPPPQPTTITCNGTWVQTQLGVANSASNACTIAWACVPSVGGNITVGINRGVNGGQSYPPTLPGGNFSSGSGTGSGYGYACPAVAMVCPTGQYDQVGPTCTHTCVNTPPANAPTAGYGGTGSGTSTGLCSCPMMPAGSPTGSIGCTCGGTGTGVIIPPNVGVCNCPNASNSIICTCTGAGATSQAPTTLPSTGNACPAVAMVCPSGQYDQVGPSCTHTCVSGTGVVTLPNQSSGPFMRNFGIGARGDDVLALKAFLISRGYLHLSGTQTNYFGPLTQQALKLYQADLGFQQTGYVGPRTRAQLNADASAGGN